MSKDFLSPDEVDSLITGKNGAMRDLMPMSNFELAAAIDQAYPRRDSSLGSAHYCRLLDEQLRRATAR